MVKNFIFIEDGSVDLENMRKILDNSGNADVKFITYRQGAAKPELVSIEQSEATQNPDVYKKEAEEEILKGLYTFLIERTERTSNLDHISRDILFRTIYNGHIDDFMTEFKNFLNKR